MPLSHGCEYAKREERMSIIGLELWPASQVTSIGRLPLRAWNRAQTQSLGEDGPHGQPSFVQIWRQGRSSRLRWGVAVRPCSRPIYLDFLHKSRIGGLDNLAFALVQIMDMSNAHALHVHVHVHVHICGS